MPGWAFALMVAGGLWVCLWTSRARLLGCVPVALGTIGAVLAPAPDLLVTGDGRHLAIAETDGVFILRDRAGDYIRSLLAEASGYDADPSALEEQRGSDCSRDACLAELRKGVVGWRLLATRSATRIDWVEFTAACASADIVVSDRRLPRGCVPRWLKLDAAALGQTGGLAIYLSGKPHIDSVADHVGLHPWRQEPTQYRRISPARRPWMRTRRGS
jgi:competence protein ComEC